MTVIPQKQESRRRDQMVARQQELHRRSHRAALTGLPHGVHASNPHLTAQHLSAHPGLSGHPLSGLQALNPHHQSLLEQHHQSMLQLELNSRFLREQHQLHSYLANPHNYLTRLLPHHPHHASPSAQIPHQNPPFGAGASPYLGAFHPKLHPTSGSPYNYHQPKMPPPSRVHHPAQLKIPQSERSKIPPLFQAPKPRGRRCALHVKIAFMIQNHQKKQKRELKNSKIAQQATNSQQNPPAS